MPKLNSITSFQSVTDLLTSMAGIEGIKLVEICEKKRKSVTDEELAKKLSLKVTKVRTILNQLHYRGIACYNKSKNSKTGWYSYTWEIKNKRIAEIILERQKEEIEKLEKRKVLEENYVLFACPKKCDDFPFEIAAEYNFRCPECGNNMKSLDQKRRISDTNKKIKVLQEEIVIMQKIK
ncbi:MAG: hypothetical protein ABH821_02170 [archaeon]